MAYTTIDKPSDYFNTKLYTGTGSSHAITGVGFAPNWVWIKHRNEANPHKIFDTVRGVGKSLKSNSTDVEASNEENGYVSAFGSDGFTLVGGSTSSNDVNKSSGSYVAWNWKAETSFSNSAGANGADIASSGSVNTTAGFSIVKWVGNATDDQQILHGLSSTVKMIICKRYIGGSADSWIVYHVGLPVTQYLILNSTSAGLSDNEVIWSDEHPTSSVFTVGNHGTTNDDGSTMIGYCFADVQGFSKMGSYTGNGNADGTFNYLGFKPAWIMCKRAVGGTGNWGMNDTKRDPFNLTSHTCDANNADDADDVAIRMDILSNGFKLRTNSSNWNTSGDTYIYMAFAESPFVTSTGVPATAR